MVIVNPEKALRGELKREPLATFEAGQTQAPGIMQVTTIETKIKEF